MSDPIFEGDVVQLNSGGPEMTVTKIEDGQAVCTWPDTGGEDNLANNDSFALEELNFVRRYSVGRTELTAGDGTDDNV